MLNQFVTFNLKTKIDKNVQNKFWTFFENIENVWWGNERTLKGKESEIFKCAICHTILRVLYRRQRLPVP